MSNRNNTEMAVYRSARANDNGATFIDSEPHNLEQDLYDAISARHSVAALEILDDHLETLDINIPLVVRNQDLHSRLGTTTFLLHAAVRCGDVDVVRVMASHPDINFNIRAKQTLETALHFAAELEDHRILELLLRQRVSVNALNVRDQTPLMFAVNKGLVKNVELLCNAEVNLGFIYPNGETILSYAIKEAFTAKANLDAVDNADSNARITAQYENLKRIIRILLLNGAGMGSDFPIEFYRLGIDMCDCWCFGATVNGEVINPNYNGFADAIMTLDQINAQYSAERLPNPQLVLRFEELRSRLSNAEYADFKNIMFSLQREKLLPIHQDRYIDAAAESHLFQQRLDDLSRIAVLLPDNITNRILRSKSFSILTAFGIVGAASTTFFGAFLSHVFLTLMYTNPVTEINCWNVLPVLFTNNTYARSNAYPGCGGLFTFFFGSALLVFLTASTIIIRCIVVGSRSRNTYLQLEDFENRIKSEDKEGGELRLRQLPPIDVVRCSLVQSEQLVEPLQNEYRLYLRELRELHPRYTNQPRFYAPAPAQALPGYQRGIQMIATPDDFSVNVGEDEQDDLLKEKPKYQI